MATKTHKLTAAVIAAVAALAFGVPFAGATPATFANVSLTQASSVVAVPNVGDIDW
jgi:hypothetical protein